MKEKVKYWMDMAEYDLETALVMLKGKRFLYVGFMCHQVIEKILKGYYVFVKADNPPYTHNLSYIADKSKINDKMTEEQKDFIDLLEPLNVEARYPSHKERLMLSLNDERCKEIIQKTEGLYQWIKQQLLGM
ncbi:MAG: HEPN domain-containing protein [Thermodesulfobacteriota bacterium]|nr:HEPN domain-containing protein [Thermodesulfobacteriota bacterium]